MIKQEAIFKKLGYILEELNEQHQYLAQNTQEFNQLELDLFLANAKFLADHIEIIKKIAVNQPNDNHKASEKIEEDIQKETSENFPENLNHVPLIVEEEAEFDSNVQAIKIDNKQNSTPVFEEMEEDIFKLDKDSSSFEFILNAGNESDTIENIAPTENNEFRQDSFIGNESKLNTEEKFEFEEKTVDEIFNRPLSGEEERIIAENKKLSPLTLLEEQNFEEEEELGPEPFLVVKEEILPIIEEELALKFEPTPTLPQQTTELILEQPNKPTLNEQLAGVNNPKNTNLKKSSITDLKQGINLNDKLLYIKDLFNGYNLAYAEAIEIANKLPSFDAAANFFQKNYAVKNNWSEKETTVAQFYELLQQRFR